MKLIHMGNDSTGNKQNIVYPPQLTLFNIRCTECFPQEKVQAHLKPQPYLII